MIFYVIADKDGGVFQCSTKLSEAKRIAIGNGKYNTVSRLDVEVSAESIRRILGNCGGYCKSSDEVFVS